MRFLDLNGYNIIAMTIAEFVKQRRKELKLTQEELALRSGVGIRFLRELERGKKTLQMDKVNEVLRMFGKQLGLAELDRNQLDNEKS